MKILTFHSFRVLGSTYSRLHHRLPKSFNADAISSLHFQCDSCDMWIHNECTFIAETQHETVSNINCTWICPKCEFFNFSDSFFDEQVNLETENRFVPLTKEKKDMSSPCGTNKSKKIAMIRN